MLGKEELHHWVKNPDLTDSSRNDALNELIQSYPYFQTARLLLAKGLHATGDNRYEEELSRAAVLCADRRKLFYLIEKDAYQKFLSKPEKPEPHDRTTALLDTFLTSIEETPEENPLPTDLHIVSVDYLSYLDSVEKNQSEEATETETQPFRHQNIIDTFLEKAASDELFTPSLQPATKSAQQQTDVSEESEFLTETLARIYIKQKKYEQALTIIKRLSLNFPKKSVYFADQIRFLEYLILNEKNKSN